VEREDFPFGAEIFASAGQLSLSAKLNHTSLG